MNTSDTIAALATAPGEAAISVLRISGPDALAVADRVFSSPGLPPSRRESGTFAHGIVRDKAGRKIDDALLLIMRAPRSYTGEDVVELQGHGGSVAPRWVLRACLDAGCRPAEPGEFTRRAFFNGKRDLLQVEAILDLIRARSERAASAAVEQLEGVLSEQLNNISEAILQCAVEIEAGLDFPEEDIPPGSLCDQEKPLRSVIARIDEKLQGWEEGRWLREGARVVLLGRPNVGKSTLFNALLGQDRAIVTPHPGTTRDLLEEGLVLGGFPIRLIDTAGLRHSECPVEREGVARTRKKVPSADIAVYLLDASQRLNEEDRAMLETLPNATRILVLNKTDLGRVSEADLPGDETPVSASLSSGRGLQEIREAIRDRLQRVSGATVAPHAVISERHRNILESVKEDVSRAASLAKDGREDLSVPVATHLRSALEKMGELTGRVCHEDLLNGVFSRFCVGK